MSPQNEGEQNKSTGVGGETGDLETDSWSVSGSVAGVVTVGTSGVLVKLGNWETTTLEGCLSEGPKESSLEEAILKETISSEGSEGLALLGVVALLDEVALPEWVAPSEETGWTKRDKQSNGRIKPGYIRGTMCTELAKGGTSGEKQTRGGTPIK